MTARFRHGLVVGKFYPPHAGHHVLIDAAARVCDRVSVVVAASSVESIPLDERASWLAAGYADRPRVVVLALLDDHPVDYGSARAWDAHMALFEAAVARGAVLDGLEPAAAVIDAVFSSEPYGAEMARRLGAADVRIGAGEPRRSSGTAVRADVVGRWDDLAPAVKAGLTLRVVFVGAESTGTTTASREVARALRARGGAWGATAWVPEFGRSYTVGRLAVATAQAAAAGRPPPGMADLIWTPEDFVAVATRQLATEDTAAATGSPVLVCDTDAFATAILHERYVGSRHPAVEAIAEVRVNHLYLLTDHHDVPFAQDGVRDGEHLRPWMTERFAEALGSSGRRWDLLTGPPRARVATALAAIDRLCGDSWQFSPPLG